MEDCRDYLQPYYYPEEAVRDWCAIPPEEFKNYPISPDTGWPDPDVIGQKYPCYPKRLAILKHEMNIGAIPVGRDGKPVAEGDHVAPHRRTVLPEDLKAWMEKKFPNERPAFLFNHLERRELSDRKTLLAKVEELETEVKNLNESLETGRELYRKLKREKNELEEQLKEYEKPQKGKNFHNVNLVKANEKLQNLLNLLSAAIAIYRKNPKLTRNSLAERLSEELGTPRDTINKYWKDLESLPHAEELLPPKAGGHS